MATSPPPSPPSPGDPPVVTLVLAKAQLPDGTRCDLHIAEGRIAARSPLGSPPPPEAQVIDCDGKLVAPSFVEGHIHLDKTLLGLPLMPHRPGATVAERIAAEKAMRRDLTTPVTERGGRLIEQIVRFGTGHVRSHVDIDTDVGLTGLESLLLLKERYADRIDLQIVAFPQSGIRRDPGTADLLDAALRSGADLVGGLDPAGIDDDLAGHLDVVFGLAERHDVGIDIHLHDPGPLGAFELREIAARTQASGMQGRVAVSHAYALGAVDDADFGRTAQELARARVAIMTNGPGTGPMPPLTRMWAAGVTVFAGSDNIRDAWSPFGNGDMLARAGLIGYRQETSAPDLGNLFAMATTVPAAVMGVSNYGCAQGDTADLVILPVASVAEAVLGVPRDRVVLKAGRIVATPHVAVQ